MTETRKSTITPEQSNLIRSYIDQLGGISRIRGGWQNSNASTTYRYCIDMGKSIRDYWLHQYTILPGAMTTFKDTAVSREWLVAGRPVAAARAVKKLNDAHCRDSMGIIHRGWEQFMSRLVMDWSCVGRCMFTSSNTIGDEWTAPEYIDVTQVGITTDMQLNSVWDYVEPFNGQSRIIPQNEMFFTDNIPMGSQGVVVGRIYYILPIANLDWLMREHDSIQMDGRKIRDIIVTLPGMADSIEQSLVSTIAMAAGEDPSKHGVQIVEVETMGYQGPLSDLFHRVGLSEIPRDFDREKLLERYAREIAANLGMPIGQFWYDPRGTNRSLEQVQQERSTLKGPSFFVRSLARTINNSAILGRTPATKAILIFEEETDNTSLKMQAEAVKLYAEAIEKWMNIETINPEFSKRWLQFFEQKNLIPPNSTLSDIVTRQEADLKRNIPDYDKLSIEDKQDIATEQLKRGWVKMNRDGMVVDKRYDFVIPVVKKEIDAAS